MKRHEVIVNDVVEDRTFRQKTGYIKRYKTGKLLGKGGFAKCFEMVSFDSQNTYACKVIPKASLTKSSARKKLLNEIKIHRSLRHPNVVKFERFFEDKRNVYILLELCPNQTMMEMIGRRKILSESEVQYWMWQLVTTVHFLHKNNVIHRDLKLGNMFIGDKMDIKLGDFGLATKLNYPNERKRTICGTPNYIAPEILDNRNGHSFEVDVWSIGVIMFTLLFGKPPFETRSVKTTYKRIKNNVWTFPPDIRVSQAAKHLITRILHTSPDLRPTTSEMLRDEFFHQMPFPKYLPVTALSVPPRLDLSNPLDRMDTTDLMELVGHVVTSGKKHSGSGSHSKHHTAAHTASDTDKENKPIQHIKKTHHGKGQHQHQGAHVYNPNTANFPRPSAHVRTISSASSIASSGSHHQRASSSGGDSVQQPLRPLQSHQEEAKQFGAPFGICKLLGSNNENAYGTRSKARGQRPQTSSKRLSASPQSDPDDEFKPLKQLQKKIEKSFMKAPSSSGTSRRAHIHTSPVNSCQNDHGLVWVTKWVDYSHKYGIAYTLSNGASGVFFNDATKLVASAQSNEVNYVERKAKPTRQDPQKTRRVDCPPVRFTREEYPKDLHKKMYLLSHFQKHLEQHKSTQDVHHGPSVHSGSSTGERSEFVYVRKYMRTKHAILFWLSNRTVQVIFYDCTEVLVSSQKGTVTYTNKNRDRQTHRLDRVFDEPKPDLERRLTYTKDILSHMLKAR